MELNEDFQVCNNFLTQDECRLNMTHTIYTYIHTIYKCLDIFNMVIVQNNVCLKYRNSNRGIPSKAQKAPLQRCHLRQCHLHHRHTSHLPFRHHCPPADLLGQ